MDKYTHILGHNMSRDSLIRLSITSQVIDKELFETIYKDEPLMATLMLEKFKQYLNDPYYTDIERQTILIKFLRNEYLLDIVSPVIEFLQECDLKDDYTKIIMEWTLRNSEVIKYQNLEKYDGTELCYSLDQNNKVLGERKDLRNQVLDTILELHNRFIIDSMDLKEDEGE